MLRFVSLFLVFVYSVAAFGDCTPRVQSGAYLDQPQAHNEKYVAPTTKRPLQSAAHGYLQMINSLTGYVCTTMTPDISPNPDSFLTCWRNNQKFNILYSDYAGCHAPRASSGACRVIVAHFSRTSSSATWTSKGSYEAVYYWSNYEVINWRWQHNGVFGTWEWNCEPQPDGGCVNVRSRLCD